MGHDPQAASPPTTTAQQEHQQQPVQLSLSLPSHQPTPSSSRTTALAYNWSFSRQVKVTGPSQDHLNLQNNNYSACYLKEIPKQKALHRPTPNT